jgi:uncharacterized protein (UPF0332 family)
MTPTDSLMLEVSQAKSSQFNQWRRGIRLELDSGLRLEDLRTKVVADRWQLALDFNDRGAKLLRSRPPLYRDAISRFYYSMYHALRAVAYFTYFGDDHEEHRALPSAIPRDFYDNEIWANNLKNARDTRNRADYEPYPAEPAAWASDAGVLKVQAADLLERTKLYLTARGCVIP